MKLRKAKWEYELPSDTHEIMSAYLMADNCNFAIQQVRPHEIYRSREKDKEKGIENMVGKVIFIAVETQVNAGKVTLLTYPSPDKAATLILRATKLVEL